MRQAAHSLQTLQLQINRRMGTLTPLLAIVALTLLTGQSVQAQTFSVIHTFTGGSDGWNPYAGLTIDGPGTLYGTTFLGGGINNSGVVFKLSLRGSGWTLSPLYQFTGSYNNEDPAGPVAPVTIGPNGSLYGTTSGNYNGVGSVFQLRPPATACKTAICYWSEDTIYSFNTQSDGDGPNYGPVIFDRGGNIYGATFLGGTNRLGVVYELSPSEDGWTESILHNFAGPPGDGSEPYSGLVMDAAGNLYGTTFYGGNGGSLCGDDTTCGVVYELTPSNGSWTEQVVVNFGGTLTGANPEASLIQDQEGNFYGTASIEGLGAGGGGTAFKLANGNLNFSVMYSFDLLGGCGTSGLVMDAHGNFFGACYYGGPHATGQIYELTNCTQSCALHVLYTFTGGSDGSGPYGTPVLDADGNLYGTTVYGGQIGGNCGNNGCGVVWEITP